MTTSPLRARINRAVLATASLVGGLTLAGSLLSAPAQSAAPSYVALGDSYSSGTGTRTYLADGSDCLRSSAAYPSLIAAARGYSLNFRACSGAVIDDVVNAQLPALNSTTTYVSISIGGNDAGFADVLTECAKPGWMSNCDARINTAQAYVANTLPGRLSGLYSQIRTRAPRARVVVVGYPRIFNGEDCNAATFFSPAEEARLNQTADQLNARLAAAASAAGFSFANPTSRFVGHAVCDSPEWINGLSWPIVESYHPNTAGHASGYTPTVSPLLTGAALTVTPELAAAAAAQGPELARTQSAYAGLDATIEPKEFHVPDLDSPQARRAAQRAGIDLDAFVARHQR